MELMETFLSERVESTLRDTSLCILTDGGKAVRAIAPVSEAEKQREGRPDMVCLRLIGSRCTVEVSVVHPL